MNIPAVLYERNKRPLWVRNADGTRRLPRISLSEAAIEFGVTAKSLGAFLRSESAPKPVLLVRGGNAKGGMTYFDAQQLRAWWKSLPHKEPA